MIADDHEQQSEEDQIQMNLSNYPSAKLLLDHLFSEWLLSEGEKFMRDVRIEEFSSASSSSSSSAASTSSATLSSASSSTSRTSKSSGGASIGESMLNSKSPRKRGQAEIYSPNSTNSDGGGPEYNDSESDVASMAGTENSDSPPAVDRNLHESSTSHESSEPEFSAELSPDTPRHRSKPNYDTIPAFYKPGVKLWPISQLMGSTSSIDNELESRRVEIEAFFALSPGGILIQDFVGITKRLCGLPSFFNLPFCLRVLELYDDDKSNVRVPSSFGYKAADRKITLPMFLKFWAAEIEPFDKVERFFRAIKKPKSEFIAQSDLMPFIQELLRFHPGLEFLESHQDFQLKYAVTVATRIFYKVNTSRSGKISLRELRRSNLFYEFMHVDEECDINRVTEYFSYEHFYVLYCRFFELDADKDSLLQKEDVMRYAGNSLSDVAVDRILQVGSRAFTDGFEGPSPGSSRGMTYPDFIYFMMNEEDKTNELSLKYWFNICDLDGDGKLSFNDMNFFYARQFERLQSIGQEPIQFPDVLCQMMDMIAPEDCDNLTIKDFTHPERKQFSGSLFEVLTNLPKFTKFESRDPFAEKLRMQDGHASEWNRFCAHEYTRLSSEEESGQLASSQGSGTYSSGPADYLDSDNIDFDDDIDAGYSDSDSSYNSYKGGGGGGSSGNAGYGGSNSGQPSRNQTGLQLNLANIHDGAGSDDELFSEDDSDSDLMDGARSSDRDSYNYRQKSTSSSGMAPSSSSGGTNWGGWSLTDDSSDDDAGVHPQKKGLVASGNGGGGGGGGGAKSSSGSQGTTKGGSSSKSAASSGSSGSSKGATSSKIVQKGGTGSTVSTASAAASASTNRNKRG